MNDATIIAYGFIAIIAIVAYGVAVAVWFKRKG